MPTTTINNNTQMTNYTDILLSLLHSVSPDNLDHLRILLDDKVSGIDKFEAFLKIISDNNVKVLYAYRDELQTIIEKHILFNS